ncbi:MAG: DpnII family type II restriction endonuclease [Candidatus Saccharibacteria bacterium]|nr:DpnII family type II restriction endonuclease [Candidatus Saccharibacteria bacterium]
MKFLDFYQSAYGTSNQTQIFQIFLDNLKSSNMLWDYFVDWEKVFAEVENLKYQLHLLNSLLNENNFEQHLYILLDRYPEVIRTIPLLAVRITKNQKYLRQFTILDSSSLEQKKLRFLDYNFDHYNPLNFNNYLIFIRETGIQNLFQNSQITNLVDYMIGVEAGLNSNARKNRSGKSMEAICKIFIEDICQSKNCQYICQADAQKIYRDLGYSEENLQQGNQRKYDFVIASEKQLSVVEVNFYNNAGSKLGKTAIDYQNLSQELKNNNIKFIWITDGRGWHQETNNLKFAFENMDYIFNLDMLEKNILDQIF